MKAQMSEFKNKNSPGLLESPDIWNPKLKVNTYLLLHRQCVVE